PVERAPWVPHWIDAIVDKALKNDPAQRFDSALAMAAAIEAGGNPASNEELAAWVRGLAADSLARRDELVAMAERETSPSRRSAELGEILPAILVERKPRGEGDRAKPETTRKGMGVTIGVPLAGILAGLVVSFAVYRLAIPPSPNVPPLVMQP